MTSFQRAVLDVVRRHGTISCGDIAYELGRGAPNVAAAARVLADRGRVTMATIRGYNRLSPAPPGRTDNRTVVVSLVR